MIANYNKYFVGLIAQYLNVDSYDINHNTPLVQISTAPTQFHVYRLTSLRDIMNILAIVKKQINSEITSKYFSYGLLIQDHNGIACSEFAINLILDHLLRYENGALYYLQDSIYIDKSPLRTDKLISKIFRFNKRYAEIMNGILNSQFAHPVYAQLLNNRFGLEVTNSTGLTHVGQNLYYSIFCLQKVGLVEKLSSLTRNRSTLHLLSIVTSVLRFKVTMSELADIFANRVVGYDVIISYLNEIGFLDYYDDKIQMNKHAQIALNGMSIVRKNINFWGCTHSDGYVFLY